MKELFDVFDDGPEPDFEDPEIKPRPDPKVEEAATELLGFIQSRPDEVFYEMQLEVLFEDHRVKLKMCESLGLKPLFIARMMPRSYVFELFKKGGFALLMKYQFYPFGSQALAELVRQRLGLPTGCPRRLEDGTLQRLLRYHDRASDGG